MSHFWYFFVFLEHYFTVHIDAESERNERPILSRKLIYFANGSAHRTAPFTHRARAGKTAKMAESAKRARTKRSLKNRTIETQGKIKARFLKKEKIPNESPIWSWTSRYPQDIFQPLFNV